MKYLKILFDEENNSLEESQSIELLTPNEEFQQLEDQFIQKNNSFLKDIIGGKNK